MRAIFALALFVSLARAGDWISESNEGFAAVSKGDYQTAETFFRESWESADTPRRRAIEAGNVASVLHRTGRNREALDCLEKAWQVYKEPVSAASLSAMYRLTGDYLRAEQTARDALGGSPADPDAKTGLLNTLADLLRERGHNAEAKSLFEQANDITDAPWKNRFESLIGLATIDSNADQWREAVQMARGNNDSSLEGVALRGLAQTWIASGDTRRAEPLLRQALAIFEAGSEPNGHQTASTLTHLAELYLAEDKAGMAEDALLRASSIDERILGPDHPQVAVILEMLADAVAQLGRLDQSRLDFDRAAAIMCARFGEKSAVLGAVFANRGFVEQRAGHLGEAADAYRRALASFEDAGDEAREIRITAMEHYAQVLKASHRPEEAKVLLAQVKAFGAK